MDEERGKQDRRAGVSEGAPMPSFSPVSSSHERASFEEQLEKTSPSTPYPSARAGVLRRWAWSVRRWLARLHFDGI